VNPGHIGNSTNFEMKIVYDSKNRTSQMEVQHAVGTGAGLREHQKA
jgi:hypothetical protein